MLSSRALNGARQNRLDAALSRMGQVEEATTRQLSDTEDADIAETLIELNSQQNAYQAALKVRSQHPADVPHGLPPLVLTRRRSVPMSTLTFESTRFGTVEIDEEAVIEFPAGLIGLGGARYALISADPEAPVRLAALGRGARRRPARHDPWRYFGDYAVELSDADTARIGASDADDAAVWVDRSGRFRALGLQLQPPRADRDLERLRPQVINEAPDAPSALRCSPRRCRGAHRRSRAVIPRRKTTVLIITRKPGEKIMLGDDVVIHVMEIVGNSVRVGIQAPRSLPVYREEIWDAVRAENRAAATAMPGALPAVRPAA